jgi:hypothetical protein
MRHRSRHNPDATVRWGWFALMMLIAAPMLLGATWMTWRSLWFKFGAASTIGTVIEKVGSRGPHLVVQYRDATGEPMRIESAGSDFYQDLSVGDPVRVLHDPANFADARLDHFVELWILPMVLGAFGSVLALSTWFMVWQMGRT